MYHDDGNFFKVTFRVEMTFGQVLESSTFGVLGAFGKPSVSYFWSSGNFLSELGILSQPFGGCLKLSKSSTFGLLGTSE